MSIAGRLSAYNRARKFAMFNAKPTDLILDVGFTETEFSASDNYLEKHCPHLERVTALGLDEPILFAQRYAAVKAVRYDGRTFPFADKSFDVVWSNAVLEHVADQNTFLREINRVGKRAFITTPNRYFPIEVHTRIPLLHWLPKDWFDWILRRVNRGWAAGSYMNLLSETELGVLLDEAGIDDYRIVRNRLFGFTLDFVVMVG